MSEQLISEYLDCLRRKTSIIVMKDKNENLQPGKNDFKKTTRELWDFYTEIDVYW